MRSRVVVPAVLMLVLAARSVAADAAVDALFDASRLHDVQINMSADDWSRLRANYLLNTNYDATVTFDGETIANSTIRSRGSGTRNGIKPGLRVDFNRKIKSQTFHGFKTLVVDNMYNDASFLREQLAFAVFREAGITVPRESFARLTVNGQYWGLYAIVEPIDQHFVASHVDDGDGNLFEYNAPNPPAGQLLSWGFVLSRGATIDGYVPSPFEPKTHEDDLDGSALLDFIRTVTDARDATFVDEVSAFVDPRVLLTYYAVEVATGEVDGLTSFLGINNFYLYQREHSRSFVFLPWDHDFNFTNAAHSIYFGAGRNLLIRRLLADAQLRELYRATLQSIVTEYVNPGWMGPRIDAMVSLIRDSVLQDTKRRGGDDPVNAATTFDDAVLQIRTFVDGRREHVEAVMQTGRRRSATH
jgi:spore coat protein CotH